MNTYRRAMRAQIDREARIRRARRRAWLAAAGWKLLKFAIGLVFFAVTMIVWAVISYYAGWL